MTNKEIAREYKLAKNKIKQIGILADLNGKSKEEIREILRSEGIEVGSPGRKKVPVPTSEGTVAEKAIEAIAAADEFSQSEPPNPKKLLVPPEVIDAVIARKDLIKTDMEEMQDRISQLLADVESAKEAVKQLDSWLKGVEPIDAGI